MLRRTAQLGIEDVLWQTANDLRGSVDSAHYKHVVLGIFFLKYLFDASGHDSRDTTPALTVGDMSWNDVLIATSSDTPARELDRLIVRVEDLNPAMRDAFPRLSGFEGLSGDTIARLAATLTNVDLAAVTKDGRDVLSRTYEYFLTKFAASEGRLGGEFYTPQSIVRLMVALLQPFEGKVYDPACGTGGLLVQAKTQAHAAGRHFSATVFGQESNPLTWRLSKINLALHGIDADLGAQWGDTFANDQHASLEADYILTNPPFGKGTYWPRDRLSHDPRWAYGVPPASPSSFAWLQHYVARLSDTGVAVTVMSNGPLTSRGTEGRIRAELVQHDLIECIISLPPQLFYSTPVPVSLWILNRDKKGRISGRDRSHEVLLVDARQLGTLVSKVHRDLDEVDLGKIVGVYHDWRDGALGEIAGFARSVTTKELESRQYSLNPSEYLASGTTQDGTQSRKRAQVAAVDAQKWLDALEAVTRTARTYLSADDLRLALADPHPSMWLTVRLRDIARVVGGGTPDTKEPSYFGGSIPWITPKDLASLRGLEVSSGQRSLSDAGLAACGARLIPAGAILVSSRAPIGLVALAANELTTNQGIRSVVLTSAEHDPRFWCHLLRASRERLDAAGNGTTFRELRGSTFADMTFTVPRLSEQRRIADYLGALETTARAAQEADRALRAVIDAAAPALVNGQLRPL